MLSHTYVVLDLETTGLNPTQDKIIEIAAVRLQDGNIIKEFNTLVNPGKPIPANIQKLTGINEAMVSQAPYLDEVLPAFQDFSKDAILVAHNGKFDLAFINHALRSNYWQNQNLLDTLDLSRIIFPCLPSHRLEYLSQALKINVYQHHRAREDVLATVELFKILWQATMSLDKTLLKKMLTVAPPSLQTWFMAALQADTIPDSPTEIAATGLFAINLEGNRADSANRPDFSLEEMAALLQPCGRLANIFPGYEYRSQQITVLKAVAEALLNNKYLAVEAGTGTGKSLAYLLPAIYWACHQKKRVAIATHTISLQEQLIKKEVPQLQELLPFPFKATLVKGRSNYLCRRKLRDALNNPAASDSERIFLLRILRWLKLSTSGDWNELKLTPEEEDYKIALAAHKETCIGTACPFSNYCFVNLARQEAEDADIIILNHSLLLSDIKLDNQVLPSYPYLIIDEAHHLEEAATEHLGLSVSMSAGNLYWRRLGQKDNNFSLLGRLWQLLPGINSNISNEIGRLLQEIEQNVLRAKQNWQLFWDSLFNLKEYSKEGQRSFTIRFTDRLKETPAWDNVLVAFGELETSLTFLVSNLNRLHDLLVTIDAGEIAADVANFSNIFYQLTNDFCQVLEAEPDESISWLEQNHNQQPVLRLAPLNAGPLLAKSLYAQKQAVILTSATLTVDNDFTFYLEQVGLNILSATQVETCQVASPFDYQSQSLVCAIKGLPNPGQLDDSTYAQIIAPILANILASVEGRVLVLCTSHRFLREVYNNLNALNLNDFNILGQGIDGNRNQLLEEFCQTPRALLLGASTFWEGIDLPGEMLRCVVIPRLPFPSPGLPALAARMEHLATTGRNAFTALSLPAAIIRFRQGFGRLIRRATDRGVLVVLDQRLLSRRYGHLFLRSLPPVTKLELETEEITTALPAWFNVPPPP
ncbi:MAG: DEAD/DEAH box helicase family protein [Clostridia bacterium]|nr:DEAD/DEAH box helicase family protein [Clostridia bacterium]